MMRLEEERGGGWHAEIRDIRRCGNNNNNEMVSLSKTRLYIIYILHAHSPFLHQLRPQFFSLLDKQYCRRR